MWVILPGLALTPSDYAALAAHLPGRTAVLDAWALPTTSGLGSRLDPAGSLGLPPDEPINLIGHSIGGLAALEWALTDRVNSLTLLDPTPLGESSSIGIPLRIAAPFGPAVRKISMLALTGKDVLSPAERRARFGTVAGLRTIDAQLRQLAQLSQRVATLLSDLPAGHVAEQVPTLHVVALPRVSFGLHRRSQRALAALIGSAPVEVRGWNHLFPVGHPAELAELITARLAEEIM